MTSRGASGFLALLYAVILFSASATGEEVAMATMSPEGSPSRFVYDRLLETIERETGGLYSITPFFNGELGPEESYFSAMRRGRIQLSAVSGQGIGTVVPEYAVLRAPYLFETFDELAFVYDSFLLDVLADLFSAKGMVHLQWAANGWENTYAQEPLLTPSDAAGYRIRVPLEPNAALFFGAVGADVIQIPFTDIIPSLQTGLIDGGESTTLMYVQASLYSEAPNLIRTRHGFSLAVYAANKTWFDSLPGDIGTLFRHAYMEPRVAFPILSRQTNALLETLSGSEITVHDLTLDQRKQWQAAAARAVDNILAQVGGRSQEIYDLVVEGKRAYARNSSNDSPL